MSENHIVPFVPEDLEEAAGVLSRAMVTTPIHVAVYLGAGEHQRKVQEEQFAQMLRDRPYEVFLVKRGNRVVGVTRHYRCEGERNLPDGFEDLLQAGESGLSDVGSRENLWRGHWLKRDPQKLHNHLGPIAVLPEYQGQGIGSIMMNSYCSLVDNRSLPAYLETDRSENVRFYEKFGFRLVDEVEILGVTNSFMWREAR
jgi:GNAT superfamily N-acetyltransferase